MNLMLPVPPGHRIWIEHAKDIQKTSAAFKKFEADPIPSNYLKAVDVF